MLGSGSFIQGTARMDKVESYSYEAHKNYEIGQSFLVNMGGDVVYVDKNGMCFLGKRPIRHYAHSGPCEKDMDERDFGHYLGKIIYSHKDKLWPEKVEKKEPSIEWF